MSPSAQLSLGNEVEPVARVGASRAGVRSAVLTLAMAVAAAALFAMLPDRFDATIDADIWMVFLIVVAYGVYEYSVFNVVFRENAISYSLSEIPFALALVYLAPTVAIPVRLLLAVPVLVFKRHSRGHKLVFNVVLFVFEVMVGYTVLRAGVELWGADDGVLVAMVVVATASTSVLTSILISTAIACYEGDWWDRVTTQVRATWWLYPITSVLGAMTLGLSLVQPGLVVLAALPTGGIWYVLYRFGVQNQTLQNLHSLYGFTGRVGRTLDVNEICDVAVGELAREFRATGVMLTRFGEGQTHVYTHGHVPLEPPDGPDDEHWIGLLGPVARVVSQSDLVRRGAVTGRVDHPAYTVALTDAGDVFGAIVVFAPPLFVDEFGTGDGARLTTLAEQLSVSLRRGMLHERLEYEARHDALTDLPARTLFERAVTEALAATGPDIVAVMMLDLDRFKEVNDTLGHHAGDALLVEFSRRMSALLAPGDMLARLAGDEFAILCRRGDADGVVELARGCVDAGGRPVVLDGLEIVVTVSVGVAFANPNETDALQPMRRADIAMYNAKWQRTGVEVYRDEIDRRTPARLSMLGDLRSAIAGDEIVVVYQPKLDLHTLEIAGVEALVRWNSPTRGAVAPSEFVRVAEDTGLIKDLTDLVLEHGISALRRFHDLGLDLRLAVNLSTHDLFDTKLPDRVMSRLARFGVSPSALTLEITESSLLVDAPRTRATIDDLHQAGFRLAVDDFGTGYSSLSYLRRLPVQELKIDQSFVSGMLSDPQDEVIVKSTIDLGHNLRLSVVAEGVEDDATLHALAAMGCDVAQGFGIARPLAAHDLIDWITRARRQQHAARVETAPDLSR